MTTHEPLHTENDETSGNIEFLQPYQFVAAGELLTLQLFYHSVSTSHRQTVAVSRNFNTSRCIVLLGLPSQDMHCQMLH
jgi:hypothetical protein